MKIIYYCLPVIIKQYKKQQTQRKGKYEDEITDKAKTGKWKIAHRNMAVRIYGHYLLYHRWHAL